MEPGTTLPAASSGEVGPLQAGTYTFSTAIKTAEALTPSGGNYVHATVMVRDASAAGPPIE